MTQKEGFVKIIFLMFFVLNIQVAVAGVIHPIYEQALPEEDQLQARIVEGILDIQHKNSLPNGQRLRGTHSKGVCAKANFEVYGASENIPNELQIGLFSQPNIYKANLRFANAESKILPDQEPDVRSLSFSIEGIDPVISNPQGRIDFSTNDSMTFPINDAETFASIMTLSLKGLFWGGVELGLSRVLDAKNAFSLGAIQKKPAEISYQNLRYWSGVAFLLGQNAIKYSLTPCESNSKQDLNSNDPDALKNELIRHLKSNEPAACFYFQVQPLDENALTDDDGHYYLAHEWVENATWEWSEKQIPFITLGKLTLDKASIPTDSECEKVRFNVNVNTSEMHRGLGSINRARTQAEKASAENRN